jgi:hypothetical protein
LRTVLHWLTCGMSFRWQHPGWCTSWEQCAESVERHKWIAAASHRELAQHHRVVVWRWCPTLHSTPSSTLFVHSHDGPPHFSSQKFSWLVCVRSMLSAQSQSFQDDTKCWPSCVLPYLCQNAPASVCHCSCFSSIQAWRCLQDLTSRCLWPEFYHFTNNYRTHWSFMTSPSLSEHDGPGTLLLRWKLKWLRLILFIFHEIHSKMPYKDGPTAENINFTSRVQYSCNCYIPSPLLMLVHKAHFIGPHSPDIFQSFKLTLACT